MARYHDDLFTELRAQRDFLAQEIDRMDPVAAGLRRPAAARAAAGGASLLLELLCYLGALALVAAAIFHEKIYPLLLFTRFKRPEYASLIRPGNVRNLNWWMLGTLIAGAVLLWLLARALRQVRLKSGALARAGSSVKALLGDMLRRKATLDALEQRYLAETAAAANAAAATPQSVPATTVNTAPNPGYDGPDEGAVNRSFDR